MNAATRRLWIATLVIAVVGLSGLLVANFRSPERQLNRARKHLLSACQDLDAAKVAIKKADAGVWKESREEHDRKMKAAQAHFSECQERVKQLQRRVLSLGGDPHGTGLLVHGFE